MSIENWIQLISIVAAIITAAFSYLFTERSKRIASEKALKERYYLDYIDAVNNTVDAINNSQIAKKGDAFRQLAKTQNQLLLIGSADVVKNLLVFHEYLEATDDQANNFDLQEHNRLFTNLLKSIRMDLYREKHVNTSYPVVHLFAGGKKVKSSRNN